MEGFEDRLLVPVNGFLFTPKKKDCASDWGEREKKERGKDRESC